MVYGEWGEAVQSIYNSESFQLAVRITLRCNIVLSFVMPDPHNVSTDNALLCDLHVQVNALVNLHTYATEK